MLRANSLLAYRKRTFVKCLRSEKISEKIK
jgi:hypothetical protein